MLFLDGIVGVFVVAVYLGGGVVGDEDVVADGRFG